MFQCQGWDFSFYQPPPPPSFFQRTLPRPHTAELDQKRSSCLATYLSQIKLPESRTPTKRRDENMTTMKPHMKGQRSPYLAADEDRPGASEEKDGGKEGEEGEKGEKEGGGGSKRKGEVLRFS